MGVDYQARKAAKKNRRREAEVKPRRERKKKQARRLCRGPCFQEPVLTAEDLADTSGTSRPAGTNGGELARFAAMEFGGKAAAAPEGGKPGSRLTSGGKAQPGNKRKPDGKSGTAATSAPGSPAKKPKLSTAVSLLDAKSAKMEAPRQRQLCLSAVPQELRAFPDLVQHFMAGEGFPDPMPIQTKCWALLLDGRDVQALAEPGSGKTLAYLLPAAELLARKGHDAATHPNGPLALILLPTRELAQQVASVARDLRKYCGLRTACITGGTDRQQQVEALGKQPHIVVATPGRLLDLVQDGTLQLGWVQYVVLDEADKMLGLGFAPQIGALKALLLPPEGAAKAEDKTGSKTQQKQRVQVGLFTATMPESLQQVASAWLHRAEHVAVHASAAISKSVTQAKHLQKIQEASKGLRNPPRVLIFANRIKTVRFLHSQVTEAGFRAAMLHGERSQEEREAAMADFRSGKAQVLVATDVAARGLHIRNLPYVVNYDFPTNLEQYVHRVGRTGRLATDGHAFSFFTREMARLAPPVVELLEQHGQALDPNLVKLKQAFEIAAEKMGMLADATGEGSAQPSKEDVLRNLGLKTPQQRKKERQQAQKAAKKAATAGEQEKEEEAVSDSGSDAEGKGSHGRGGQGGGAPPPPQAQLEVPPDEREAPPFFVPSKSFRGARPGYVFKKGRQGLGYYLDALEQKRLASRAARAAQQVGGAGGSSKQRKPADAAKQAQKQVFQELRQKYTHVPIGGRGEDTSKPTSSAKLRREQQKQQSAVAQQQQQERAVPMLPGRLKELKRQRELAAAQGTLTGYSSSEGEGPSPKDSKRLKALPGRLRRKLAKQRATQG